MRKVAWVSTLLLAISLMLMEFNDSLAQSLVGSDNKDSSISFSADACPPQCGK